MCYQHHYHAQRCATSKVTSESKLQIHENWRLGYPNAPNREYVVFLDICKTTQDISMKHDKEATSLLIPTSSYQIILSGSRLNRY